MVDAPEILVVDDDAAGCRLVQAHFRSSAYRVAATHNGTEALAHVKRDPPRMVLLDLHLGDEDGLVVLQALRAEAPMVPVVMLTAHRELKTAVEAIKLGAFDYLTKPFESHELHHTVERAIELGALRREVAELRGRAGDEALAAKMGPSAQVRSIVEQVERVASSTFTVLVLGETGTGKELVAQAVHRASDRRDRPFVAVDCGAIPEQLLESELFGHERGAFTGADKRRQGRLQLAEGGTFFLDEVGNLPLALQAKLLRVLESREVQPLGATKGSRIDVRLVAATNYDLQERALAGTFRADLYFRLAQYTIVLPPLRERPDDIAALSQRFLDEASIELRRPVQRVSPAARKLLEAYAWPGNVRELRNVIRQAVLRSDGVQIEREAVTPLVFSATSAHVSVSTVTDGRPLREIAQDAARAAERDAICSTLRFTGGNKSRAARLLVVDYKTLHLKLKALGITARDYAPG